MPQYVWPETTVIVVFVPYYKLSTIFHLEGLSPICLLHGVDGELSPFSQSGQLAEELERRRMPYGFYSYEGLSHYFSTSAGNATTCNWRSVASQMFQVSLDCLRGWLEAE